MFGDTHKLLMPGCTNQASVLENLNSDLNNNNMDDNGNGDDEKDSQENGHDFSLVLEYIPVVAFWCEYIGSITDIFCQLFIHAKSSEKDFDKKFLMAINFISILLLLK